MLVVEKDHTETEQYEKLRKPIQDIISFTDTIDERYREKCFELLLGNILSGEGLKKSSTQEDPISTFQVGDYPLELKTFLQQYSISEETIDKLFQRSKGEAKPLYKISEKRKAAAQIQVALMTAFENALTAPGAAFEFSMKTVRQRCAEYNVYDGNNFIFNFKTRAGLFTSLDNEVVKLTPIGKSELANFILWLSKQP